MYAQARADVKTRHLWRELFTLTYCAWFFTRMVPGGSNLSRVTARVGNEGDMGVGKQDYNRTHSGTAFILQTKLTEKDANEHTDK